MSGLGPFSSQLLQKVKIGARNRRQRPRATARASDSSSQILRAEHIRGRHETVPLFDPKRTSPPLPATLSRLAETWRHPMPIGVLFEFRGATSRAKYEKSVKLILKGRRKRLADWPVKGVLAHIAGPMPGGWRVIDVWQSRAAFNQFGKKLKPVLKKIGMQGVRPKIFPLTRFIKS